MFGFIELSLLLELGREPRYVPEIVRPFIIDAVVDGIYRRKFL